MGHRSTIVCPDMALTSITCATKERTMIRYNLEILQQPTDPTISDPALEVSSKDKPVTLSPVVQLKIFELTAKGEVKNITHMVNASYFLFVTAEPADQRVQAAGAANFDRRIALVGTTCAGMALQDEPDPSGRFAFPHLAVRRADRFRLNFSLYEGIKGTERSDAGEQGWDAPSSHGTYFVYQLEATSEVC